VPRFGALLCSFAKTPLEIGFQQTEFVDRLLAKWPFAIVWLVQQLARQFDFANDYALHATFLTPSLKSILFCLGSSGPFVAFGFEAVLVQLSFVRVFGDHLQYSYGFGKYQIGQAEGQFFGSKRGRLAKKI